MGSSRPAVHLYEYQRRWIADGHRFKMGTWARQTGKSFGTSLEAVLSALEAPAHWVFLSRGERQSRELMEKARMHAQAVGMVADLVEGSWVGEASYRMLEIRLGDRARFTGLPANPDTARGFSANVLLDEFAFHQDSRKIWTALFPSITRGFKIRIVSTPNGKQNMFYDLWADEANQFAGHKHRVTIHDAVAQGLQVDPEELRLGISDPDAWAQEYLCEFLDEATAFLPYELIASCEDELAGQPDLASGGPFYAGVDIGRRRDLFVLWVVERVGDVFWTREIVAGRKLSFAEQDAELARVWETYKPRRICMDQTGMGEKPVEDAKRRYGDYAVEGCLFTAAVKQDLAFRLRRLFEDRQVRVPATREVRDDHHAVKKVTTAAGNIRFDAERTEAGHADRFWAHALAVHAADEAIEPRIRFLPTADEMRLERLEAP